MKQSLSLRIYGKNEEGKRGEGESEGKERQKQEEEKQAALAGLHVANSCARTNFILSSSK